MSRENAVQLLPYTERAQSFLPAIPGARVEVIEDRLLNQEKTTTILLDQAFKIKEDVLLMRGNRGMQWDVMTQKFLENHMQTITQVVKQLSKDIEALENQILARDNVSTGTSFALQSLDKKHLFGIGDLRGRVARCDASIAKLSGDVSAAKHELQMQGKEIHSLKATMDTNMKEVDARVMQLLAKMESSISEQSYKVQNAQGEQHHERQLLDYKLGELLTDVRDQIQNQRTWTESQLQRTAVEQAKHIDQLLNTVREKMDVTEKRFHDNLHHLTIKVDNTEEIHKLESKLSKLKHTEDKISARMAKFETQIWDEIENMKSEYKAGFQSIQDSLNSLQQIQETKVKLESKKVQRDIKQMRRKIVELKEA
ncbi:protein FAM81B [Bombina bombina]|uniref:protein FAM81B n=1 Tax=Bombina bombina TaxID=8345 RepID=UPI00235ABD00|nr:protein FAM81B [Bombina bombina]